ACPAPNPGPTPPCPGPFWFFAEGTTRPGFDEYLELFNTAAVPSQVTITYTVDGGPVVIRQLPLAAQTRATVAVFEASQLGRGLDHGTLVEATTPVLAERTMYLSAVVAGLAVNGDHNVIAEATPRTDWWFSEGTTLPGFR